MELNESSCEHGTRISLHRTISSYHQKLESVWVGEEHSHIGLELRVFMKEVNYIPARPWPVGLGG